MFTCEYCNFFRAPILKKICERLFLSVSRSDYLSENTSKPLFKGNFAQFFIYTILSNRNINAFQINIEKKDKIIADNFELCEEFSNFFENAVTLSLNICPDKLCIKEVTDLSNPVDIAI